MARKPKTDTVDSTPMLALVDQDAPAGTNLVVVADDTPPEMQARRAAAIVLLQPERFDQFYERMKAETAAHVPDVSTAKGRDELRALAFRVTKTKTTLDKAALELTADWRARTKAVNEARAPIVERLTALADEVRKPLTDWEDAERARIAHNSAALAELRNAATIADDDTSGTVEARGREIYARAFLPPQWSEDEAAEAEGIKQATVQALVKARDVLRKKEEDAAELARLRAAESERLEKERLEREAREAAEREAAEARQREEQAQREREAAEQRARDEAARVEREREEAAAAARREAEEQAQAREREREEEHRRALEAERAERERVEREAREEREQREREAAELAEQAQRREREREAAEQAERDRLAAEQAERDRIAAEQAEAERARQADRAHRSNVQREVKEALMTCGLDEEQARKVVLAIVANNVPHCTVSF